MPRSIELKIGERIPLNKDKGLSDWVYQGEAPKGKRRKVFANCPTCNEVGEYQLNDLRNGKSNNCRECANKASSKTRTFPHEDVVKDYYLGDIKLLSQYVNAVTKNSLQCLVCGHKWKARYNDYRNQGHGCPSCANHGFKSDQPAVVYYLKLELKKGDPVYKIGITAADRLDARMKEIHSSITFVTAMYFDLGQEAYEYEQYLQEKYSHLRVSLDGTVVSGKTEFFKCNPLDVENLNDQLSLPLF